MNLDSHHLLQILILSPLTTQVFLMVSSPSTTPTLSILLLCQNGFSKPNMVLLFYCLKSVNFCCLKGTSIPWSQAHKVICVCLLLQLPSFCVSFFPSYLEKRNLSHFKHHLSMCVMHMSVCLYTHICIHVSRFV